MKTPKVSICLPNLNTLPFLEERFQTIFDQTFQDWELLVYDSFSDDGAWEYIQSLEKEEPRMRAWQGPKEGTPGSWTPCLKEARGEYVYIATSDDTCPPDFLEKMVAALEAHSDCDLAHASLKAVDEHGKDHPKNEWWRKESLFARSSGTRIDEQHVRMAPYDGLLHLMWGTVYVSITQLLIRRSLFEKIGYFQQTWGWIGDFNWDMRAGLVANTVHVPDTWGGWRNHSSQATGGNVYGSVEHDEKLGSMIEDALAACRESLSPEVWELVLESWLPMAGKHREFRRGMVERGGFIDRQAYAAKEALSGSVAARDHVRSKLGRENWPTDGPDLIRKQLEAAGLPVFRKTLPVNEA